jgi:hypothetical protein
MVHSLLRGSCLSNVRVSAYIAGQKEHHQKQDFQSEFLELLRRHEIEFDENEVFQ